MGDLRSKLAIGFTSVVAMLVVQCFMLLLIFLYPSSRPRIDNPFHVDQWEYSALMVKDDDFNSHMTKLGELGWELVFARRALDADSTANYEMIFKRRMVMQSHNL